MVVWESNPKNSRVQDPTTSLIPTIGCIGDLEPTHGGAYWVPRDQVSPHGMRNPNRYKLDDGWASDYFGAGASVPAGLRVRVRLARGGALGGDRTGRRAGRRPRRQDSIATARAVAGLAPCCHSWVGCREGGKEWGTVGRWSGNTAEGVEVAETQRRAPRRGARGRAGS